MKKLVLILVVILVAIAGAMFYFATGANEFIRAQIESQGSRFLGTQVSVASVDLKLTEGKLQINDVDVENPAGFSQQDAFSLEGITLDIAGDLQEPYRIQEITLNAPEILYEVGEGGKGNLIVLKDQLMENLPQSDSTPSEEEGANPRLIVDQVTVSDVKLTLNLENFDTQNLLEKKVYEITLPTFNAGSIGQPDGLPANQVGTEIVKKMLDNVIKQAEQRAKDIVLEKAKEKAQEEIDKKKDELLEKGKEKLKDLF